MLWGNDFNWGICIFWFTIVFSNENWGRINWKKEMSHDFSINWLMNAIRNLHIFLKEDFLNSNLSIICFHFVHVLRATLVLLWSKFLRTLTKISFGRTSWMMGGAISLFVSLWKLVEDWRRFVLKRFDYRTSGNYIMYSQNLPLITYLHNCIHRSN